MKKMKVVFGIVLSLIVLTALFMLYMHFRTYTVGKDPKFSEITRVYCMSSMYSSEYGYCYDQYSIVNRSNRCYAITDLFDEETREQVETTVPITEEEYLETLKLIEGSRFVREDAPDKDRMDGYMDEENQSADLLFDHMPDGPYELRLSSDSRRAFIGRIKEFMDDTITVSFVNEVEPADVWILENTEANLKTSLWGTASLPKAKLENEYAVTVRKDSGNSYLLRIIDTDEIYYAADDITLKDGYSLIIYRSDGEFQEIILSVYDEAGEKVADYSVFNAAL